MPSDTKSLLGISLTVIAMVIFASQDAITKTLVADLPIPVVVVVRYWAFALFALIWIGRRPGGIATALRARRPHLQFLRGTLLAVEIGVFAYVVGHMPLSASQAIFAACPLVVVALSSVVLGEAVSTQRWMAVLAGFAGVLVIIRPGGELFDPVAFLAILGAVMFACYHLLTRLTGREDSFETSFAYQAWAGALTASLAVPFYWSWPSPDQWLWLGILSVTSITGHMLLTKALALAPANLLQPFTYLHMICGIGLGYLFFDELPDSWMLLGMAIVIIGGVVAVRSR